MFNSIIFETPTSFCAVQRILKIRLYEREQVWIDVAFSCINNYSSFKKDINTNYKLIVK